MHNHSNKITRKTYDAAQIPDIDCRIPFITENNLWGSKWGRLDEFLKMAGPGMS